MASDDPLTTLEAEYCPPLDSALLSAILSDYDLSSSSAADLTSARATLDALKESALLEEAAGFDPSGTGGEDAEIWDETGASRSRETDATSVSNGAEEESGGGGGGGGSADDLEALGEDAKVALLREMFGERLGAYHVLHTLRKCGGRWEGAVEELLNHVYFGEVGDGGLEGEGVKAKGVEGFSEDNIVRRGRKTKAKGQKLRAMEERRAASVPVSSAEGEGQTGNKWLTAKEDVDFIASRTGIEILTVKSTYNEHGANVPKTINALLKQTMEETKKVVTDDALVQSHARDLGAAFPSLAPHYLTALIRLTHPSTSSAHDLAAALVAKPPPQAGLQVIPIYARPTPYDLDPDTTEPTSPRAPRSANASLARAPDDPTVALRGQSYAAARAQAFAQASAAHRRAGSDRLMGGAAAYYSQLGRELTALSAGATADAADALAERQSGAAVLDLHGIDVLNGVRIAVERVEGWWEGLGERRVNGRGGAEERGEGFRVVVGAGRHSEGGKGKLGPAVTKALRERGWRVEGAGAVLVVKGKVRR